MDRAGSSPPQAFLTSQIFTLPCGRASPHSVKRRVFKRSNETLCCDRAPCADTLPTSKRDAACRKEETGSHALTFCIRWPPWTSNRVATLKRCKGLRRRDLDVVERWTERVDVRRRAREVGSPGTHRNWHRSSLAWCARRARSNLPDRFRHQADDIRFCKPGRGGALSS
jgi:hypothetical protein